MAIDRWGVADEWWSGDGRRHGTSPATRALLHALMGAGDHPDGPPGPGPWFVAAGSAPRLWNPCEVTLEDGTVCGPWEALPADLPLGYHRLRPMDGWPEASLVVTPARCHLPDRWHEWGWAAQVYAARSRASWGIGDLADVARLGRWTATLGGGALVLSPLHAVAPGPHPQPSPYYPTSRIWRNALHLAVESVPGWADLDADRRASWVAAGRALDGERRIDRAAVWALKSDALQSLWEQRRGRGDDGFAAWRASQGDTLECFARWCALAESHGPDWRRWPAPLRHPGSPTVAATAGGELADRVAFHAWLQWLADAQLAGAARASAPARLVGDLAVGFDPAGADAWAYQDTLAAGVHVGAPPDGFNADGQDWGLPPFVPWRLRAAGYEPFVRTLRSALRHVGGLRIDHVMGLSRLFWIPPGGSARAGAYVHYRPDELLALVALESVRAGAVVVGEDLGTVEDELRDALGAHDVLSMRLLWFEDDPPERFPRRAMAAVTTHDLPTIAGVATGADAEAQRGAGMTVSEGSHARMRSRLARGADLAATIVATHRALALAPSQLVVATLDDALGVTERPNMPGTVDQWPNWSIALPAPLDELEQSGLATAVATALRQGRDQTRPPRD